MQTPRHDKKGLFTPMSAIERLKHEPHGWS